MAEISHQSLSNDLRNYGNIVTDSEVLTGVGIIPEKYPKLNNETDDSPRLQRAIDDMVKKGINHIILSAKEYQIATTINLPSNIKISGSGMTDNGMGTVLKRIADVVAFKCLGTSVLSASGSNVPKQYIHFEGIRFHGNAVNGYTNDYMQLIACLNVRFNQCEFYSVMGRQLLLHEVMDSRFFDCKFMWGGTSDGLKASIELKSESGYEYSNQIHFTNCHFEHYRGKAIETVGNNVNEIFITNTKFESLQSRVNHLYLNNANMIYLNGVQITSRGTDKSVWVTGKYYTSGTQVSANGKIYQATNTGVSGATKPSHTTGTISDGGVSWLYIETLPLISEIIKISSCSGVFGRLFFEHIKTIGDDSCSLDTFMRIVNSKNIDLNMYVYQNGNNVAQTSVCRVSTDSTININVTGFISDSNGTKTIRN